MVVGKRYAVFSMRERPDKTAEGETTTVWIRAGSAFVNRDGSLNVYLDVLPLDGRLHVREALEKRDEATEPRSPAANGSPVVAAH